MTNRQSQEEKLDAALGLLLRDGVILAAAVVLLGAIIYLYRHGGERADHHIFRGEPENLRAVTGIVKDAVTGRGRGIIQLGLLLLIATPVARVAFSAYAFARQRDRKYVVITLFVLGLLLFSLFAA